LFGVREALAHEFWRVTDHDFNHAKTWSTSEYADSDEEELWGFADAELEALKMKEEALRNFWNKD